jgi:hypothetical protein
VSWGCYARSLHARPVKDYPPKYLKGVFSEVQGVLRFSRLRSASTTDNKDVRGGTEQTRLRFYSPNSL